MRITDIGNNDLRVRELMLSGSWNLVHRTNLVEHLPVEFCGNYYKRLGGFHPYDRDIGYLYSFIEGIFVTENKKRLLRNWTLNDLKWIFWREI